MDNIIERLYNHFTQCPAVSTDSRDIRPGSIFFALKGDHFNGNAFAEQAIRAGAAYAVVDEPEFAVQEQILLADDVLSTLQHLAEFHRSHFDIPVIAVTGTNGKTTTKELIHAVLSQRFTTVSTSGNLNNHIGVPLTLLRITRETEIAVVEMGANHPGEIDLLCRIAHPGYGLITNIGKAHLEGFGGLDGVIRTKTELYRYIRETGGTLFVHYDDPLLMEHAAGISSVTYGSHGAEVAYDSFTAEPLIAVNLMYRDGTSDRISSRLYGSYNLPNILAAACIGRYFNVPREDVSAAIEHYLPDNNRSQLKETGKNLVILDAYNANPTSMKAALETFAASGYKSKTVILGDMLELGESTDEEHLAILEMLNRIALDEIYLVGPVFTRLNVRRENICFQDSELAAMWFAHHRPEGRTILVKGSRGIRLERLSEYL